MNQLDLIGKVRLQFSNHASNGDHYKCLRAMIHDFEHKFFSAKDCLRYINFVLQECPEKEMKHDREASYIHSFIQQLRDSINNNNKEYDPVDFYSLLNSVGGFIKNVFANKIPSDMNDADSFLFFVSNILNINFDSLVEELHPSKVFTSLDIRCIDCDGDSVYDDLYEDEDEEKDDKEKVVVNLKELNGIASERIQRFFANFEMMVRKNIHHIAGTELATNFCENITQIINMLHNTVQELSNNYHNFEHDDSETWFKHQARVWNTNSEFYISKTFVPFLLKFAKDHNLGHTLMKGVASSEFLISTYFEDYISATENVRDDKNTLSFLKDIVNNCGKDPVFLEFLRRFFQNNKFGKITPLIHCAIDNCSYKDYNGSLGVLLSAKPRKFTEEMTTKIRKYMDMVKIDIANKFIPNDEKIKAKCFYDDLNALLEYNKTK